MHIFLKLLIRKGHYNPLSVKYSKEIKKLTKSMLELEPEKRPDIKQILELNFIRRYKRKIDAEFLKEQKKKKSRQKMLKKYYKKRQFIKSARASPRIKSRARSKKCFSKMNSPRKTIKFDFLDEPKTKNKEFTIEALEPKSKIKKIRSCKFKNLERSLIKESKIELSIKMYPNEKIKNNYLKNKEKNCTDNLIDSKNLKKSKSIFLKPYLGTKEKKEKDFNVKIEKKRKKNDKMIKPRKIVGNLKKS